MGDLSQTGAQIFHGIINCMVAERSVISHPIHYIADSPLQAAALRSMCSVDAGSSTFVLAGLFFDFPPLCHGESVDTWQNEWPTDLAYLQNITRTLPREIIASREVISRGPGASRVVIYSCEK